MKRLQPKKSLGQNFLVDPWVRRRIVDACAVQAGDTVLEIGPGRGELTSLLAGKVKRLICVETDRDLIAPLKDAVGASVEIMHADILKVDLRQMPQALIVIGNIPYYISTPIIEKLIENRSQFSSAFLTLQLEFAQRLAAASGSRDYGSLSCYAQYYLDIKVLFKIKRTCFHPVPGVDSCFVRLRPRPFEKAPGAGEEFLFKLIRTAFQQRRKTIVNALKGVTDKDLLQKALADLGIDAASRPEDLSLTRYIELCDRLVL